MNYLLIVLTLCTVSIANFASAAAPVLKTEVQEEAVQPPNFENMEELKSETARILSIVYDSCPAKLGEAMTGANNVDKVFHGEMTDEKATVWTWKIDTIYRYPAPSFEERPVASLIIQWTSYKRTGPIAADQGTIWVKKCTILR